MDTNPSTLKAEEELAPIVFIYETVIQYRSNRGSQFSLCYPDIRLHTTAIQYDSSLPVSCFYGVAVVVVGSGLERLFHQWTSSWQESQRLNVVTAQN